MRSELGEYDLTTHAVSNSALGFEWCIHSTEGIRRVLVTPSFKNVKKQGIPGPPRQNISAPDGFVPSAQLEDFAARSAGQAQSTLREKLGRPDLLVCCRYSGVLAPEGFDATATAHLQTKVGFEWTMSVAEWEFSEKVIMQVQHVYDRTLPLPKCSVARQTLLDLAQNAAKSLSNKYGVKIDCTCPQT